VEEEAAGEEAAEVRDRRHRRVTSRTTGSLRGTLLPVSQEKVRELVRRVPFGASLARADAPMEISGYAVMLSMPTWLNELLGNALIRADDGVEGIADLSRDPDTRTGQTNGEITRLHCAKDVEQLVQIEFGTAIRRAGAMPILSFSAGGGRVYIHDWSPRRQREMYEVFR